MVGDPVCQGKEGDMTLPYNRGGAFSPRKIRKVGRLLVRKRGAKTSASWKLEETLCKSFWGCIVRR